jgi:hypothetical protein
VTASAAVTSRVAVLGVRHHGPGSARSVVAELDRLQPGIVLIEGPADAGEVLPLAADPAMVPPVALLAYAPDEPRRSAFWPYAVFSPEWQALAWAAAHRVPARFCDLPAAAMLAGEEPGEETPWEAGEGETGDREAGGIEAGEGETGEGGEEAEHARASTPRPAPGDGAGPQARMPGGLAQKAEAASTLQQGCPEQDGSGQDGPGRDGSRQDGPGPTGPGHGGLGQDGMGQDEPAADPGEHDAPERNSVHGDPVALLAAAAGYDDPERWWDQVIESRVDGGSPFAALTDAMAELRADTAASPSGHDLREQRREAHMRQALRAALKETDGTVAVVCGAWHAPALAGKLPPAAADAALLRGIPRRKAVLTWVPWTHSRLATASGYGAGITSPGWYHHLFTTPEQTIIRWLAKVAGVLRDHDLPVSTAHIIEAARLADTLAALRARPLAGLAEVSEAAKSVMCEGDDLASEFVTRDLVVGELLGEVPDSAPAVPLDADIRAQARALRLKMEALDRSLALDLRKDNDRSRSVLLHRLMLLGIDWGALSSDRVQATGTFRETWALCWRPELAVAVIDAARWGTTVRAAATAKIADVAVSAEDLATITAAVEQALRADLPGALGPVLRALDSRAAADSDVAQLMAAVPALVRAIRYGDVRGTDTAALSAVVSALTARVCAGLPAAVTSLADDAAEQLRAAVNGMQAALALHASDPRGKAAYDEWIAELTALAQRRDVHGLLAGRVVRLLTDTGVVSQQEAARRLHACLSVGIPVAAKAAWAEGFLSGGGLLLVHDRDLLAILDEWVTALAGQDFTDVLPLLRRAFGGYTAPERASIGAAVRALGRGGPGPDGPGEDIDAARAAGALRTVAAILGGVR